MKRPAILANVAAGGVLLGALVLRVFPPETSGFYPECPIFHFFHVYCPGCGATRALAALTHGEFAASLHYNALAVVLLPLLCVYFGFAYRNAVCGDEFRWPRIPGAAVHGVCALALLFGVFRNVFSVSL